MTPSFSFSAGRLMWLALLLGVLSALAGCAAGRGALRMPAGLVLSVGAPLVKDAYPAWMILPTDPVVGATLEGVGGWEGVILEWSWRDPDGEIVQRERRKLFGSADRTFLAFGGFEKVSRLGWWSVQVHGPGGLVAEKRFILVTDKDRWWAMHAEYGHERARALSTLCDRGDFAFMIGRFSFALPPEERQPLDRCFEEHIDAVVPSLASALRDSPEDESILALAYRIKKQLIVRLKAGDVRGETLEQLSLLATRWDAGLFATLLAAPTREVRLGGVDLISLTGSAEAVLFLEQGVNDEDASVRLKAVEALERISGPAAEEVLRRRLLLERDPHLRDRLQNAVANRKGGSQ